MYTFKIWTISLCSIAFTKDLHTRIVDTKYIFPLSYNVCVSWKLGLYSKQCSPLRKEFVFKVGNPFRSVFCFAIKTDKFKADLAWVLRSHGVYEPCLDLNKSA